MGLKTREWRKLLMCPNVVVGAGLFGECEWERRLWLWVSIRARERRKEMNVMGVMKSCYLD